MATCNNVTKIEPSEFLGESLFKLNTNYYNLDFGLCELGKELSALDILIRSLSAKDSPTIDLSFLSQGYFLSADIRNNSLGTTKLGVDIPTSTKAFLTAAKVQSLIDTNIANIKKDNALRWTGSEWINSSLTDEIGARQLDDLNDVTIFNTVQNGNVLRYNAALSAWFNTSEFGLSAVLDDDYDDIVVSGGGQIWNIKPTRVGELEIATGAVTTPKIANLQITNDKIADATIQIGKFADNLGDINSALNLGTSGIPICLPNQGTQIPFKRLNGALGCSINTQNNGVVIKAESPPSIPVPIGEKLGSSGINKANILKNVTTGTNIFQIKTLRGGNGIRLQASADENEIEISRSVILGLTIIGIDASGYGYTDEQIASRIALIFPPERFPAGTICNTNIEIPRTTQFLNLPVSIPFTSSYKWKNTTTSTTNCICGKSNMCCTTSYSYGMVLQWLDVNIQEIGSTNYFTGGSTISQTVNINPAQQIKFQLASRFRTFTNNESRTKWV